MRRYLYEKKVKCQAKSGDGVISREDMSLDLRSETPEHFKYITWRYYVMRLMTCRLEMHDLFEERRHEGDKCYVCKRVGIGKSE